MTTKAYESLVYMLSYTEKDEAKAAAEKLAKRYGSLHGIMMADHSILSSDDGVSEKSERLLSILVAIASRRGTDKLRFGKSATAEDIDEYFKSLFLGVTVERFYLMSFDENGAPIGVDRICEGTVNSTEIIPRKIVDIAIKRKTKSLIIAHNHPGGVAEPSVEDVSVTASLTRVLSSAGLSLERHVIVAGQNVVSVYPNE